MRPAIAALVLLTACGGEPAPPDASAALDAAATTDAASADAATCSAGDPRRLTDLGYCFDARTCCTADDCGTDRSWRCNAEGLCEEAGRTCGCATDLDCAPGAFCITNAVVCGICVETGPPCASDPTCAPSGRCVDGYCVDDATCTTY